jgi:TonB family protein
MLAQLLICSHLVASVNGQLKSKYVGKTLTLRHFYVGDHLRFRRDGTLEGSAPIGPWTVSGQLLVRKAELRDNVIHIEGRRLLLFRDEKSNKLQDLLVTVEHSREKDAKAILKALRRMDATIEILLSNKDDWAGVTAAMLSVFLASGESMLNVVPTCWSAYFELEEQRPRKTDSSEKIFYVKDDKTLVAPHIISDPEPEYSEEARDMKLRGALAITLVVNESGVPEDIQIEKPLGVGLDEESIRAVENWKFVPGRKDGKAVSVGITIEVTFNLY